MKGNIELKQYDGTQILPKDDAILYDMIVGQSGIIQGCELTWLGSNQVHINHGYGIIKGRLFEIADQTFYAKLPTTSDSYFGYIVIVVDLKNTVTPITFTPRISETAITTWTQDNDMNFTNGKYEMPIAEYKATNSGITSFSDVTKKIAGVLIDASGKLKVPAILNVCNRDVILADNEGINVNISGPSNKTYWQIDSYDDSNLRFIRFGSDGSVKIATVSSSGDFVNADGVGLNGLNQNFQNEINSIKQNFQAGVDSVYNAFASVGATPASKSLTDICNAVNNIKIKCELIATIGEGTWAQTATITLEKGKQYIISGMNERDRSSTFNFSDPTYAAEGTTIRAANIASGNTAGLIVYTYLNPNATTTVTITTNYTVVRVHKIYI